MGNDILCVVLCYFLLMPVHLMAKFIGIRDDIGMLLTCIDISINFSRRFVKNLITTDIYIIISQIMQKKRSRHCNLVQTCSMITIMKRSCWLHQNGPYVSVFKVEIPAFSWQILLLISVETFDSAHILWVVIIQHNHSQNRVNFVTFMYLYLHARLYT